MNIQVTWNGTDVTTELITYTREGNICSGITVCNFVLAHTGRNYNPYNTMVVYEGGIKKGTYFISNIEISETEHTVTLATQDITKQLSDYYIAESYEIIEPSYSKYWIEKFLTEAQISYTFDVAGDGSIMSNNDVLGMQPAIEAITKLVQMSGWYYYSDANNVLHIGKLEKNPSNYRFYVEADEVIQFSFHKDDKMLRNRSVVWGATNPATKQWAFADVRVRTGYETSSSDWRSTLVVNSHIENKASATAIANTFLKEMRNATEVKTVVCAGYFDFSLGDTIFVQTPKWNGNGLITSYSVTAESESFTTTFILDERCPRMFGYYSYDGYVYVSTAGAGVWRKPLQYTHVWENYSDGLTDLNIIDLSINNGIFSCVSNTGKLFTRSIIDAAWIPFSQPTFYNYVTNEPVSGVVCTSCSVDKFNNHVYATFAAMSGVSLTTPSATVSGELGGSWLLDINSLYPLYYTSTPIVMSNIYPSGYVPPSGYAIPSGEFRVGALDVDNNGTTQIVSAMVKTGESIQIIPYDAITYGCGLRLDSAGGSTLNVIPIEEIITTLPTPKTGTIVTFKDYGVDLPADAVVIYTTLPGAYNKTIHTSVNLPTQSGQYYTVSTNATYMYYRSPYFNTQTSGWEDSSKIFTGAGPGDYSTIDENKICHIADSTDAGIFYVDNTDLNTGASNRNTLFSLGTYTNKTNTYLPEDSSISVELYRCHIATENSLFVCWTVSSGIYLAAANYITNEKSIELIPYETLLSNDSYLTVVGDYALAHFFTTEVSGVTRNFYLKVYKLSSSGITVLSKTLLDSADNTTFNNVGIASDHRIYASIDNVWITTLYNNTKTGVLY
jgi:hypothetical protein